MRFTWLRLVNFSYPEIPHSHQPISAVILSWNAFNSSDGVIVTVTNKSCKWKVPYKAYILVHPLSMCCSCVFIDLNSHLDQCLLVTNWFKLSGKKRCVPWLQNMDVCSCFPISKYQANMSMRLAKGYGYVVPHKATKKKSLYSECGGECMLLISVIFAKYTGNSHLIFLGCNTNWGHTHCPGMNLIGITFDRHCVKIHILYYWLLFTFHESVT